MFERFTDKARVAVIGARDLAADRGETWTSPLHLLSALTTGDGVAAKALAGFGVDGAAVERQLGPGGSRAQTGPGDAEALASIGIDLDEIRRKIEDSFGEGALRRVPLTPRGPLNWTGRIGMTDQAKQVLAQAVREAKGLGHAYIGTEHLLLGLVFVAEREARGGGPGEALANTVRSLGLGYEPVRARLLAIIAEPREGTGS
jgi:ATP-dependent Clp protease ATP-binding subunit ClpA